MPLVNQAHNGHTLGLNQVRLIRKEGQSKQIATKLTYRCSSQYSSRKKLLSSKIGWSWKNANLQRPSILLLKTPVCPNV